MRYLDIIKKMTLEEKASLCVGAEYWCTKEIERLGIPKIKTSDGPHGLRYKEKADDIYGLFDSEVSTCFPSLATVANSWNKETMYKLGEALGEEAAEKGVNILLGPAINIKRSPLCGRNFEYLSEDPYLAGVLGSEYVKGLQSKNVGACVKHFATNNQEFRRTTINSVVDDRTLREIYLKAFEIVVKEAKPWSIMSAYNKLNGVHCTENKYLLDDILRKEWEYEGIVISDWGAENDRVSGIEAGQELEMPSGNGDGVNEIIEAVKSGEIPESLLDEVVDRILNIAFKGKESKKEKYNREKHHKIAEEIAEDSIVLLKNDNNILPLKSGKVAVIGDMAKFPRYQGAGSSRINSYKIENAIDNFTENNIDFEYAKGYGRIESLEDEGLIKEAVEIAKDAKTVLIFAGLTENDECESLDRKNLDLPRNQNKLIEEICKVNRNIVVVLSNGSPVAMSWKNKVKGIITGYLGGEAGARAIVNCLIGKVNPSGKLAETYPMKLEDTPCFKIFPGTEFNAEYREAIYVGYRYYDKVSKEVLFPFGYGLSYTNFKYSKLNIEQNGSKLKISFNIKNIGDRRGKEIAEIYVSQKFPVIFKPEKELKGFEKVELESGEEKEVTIILEKTAFEYYNTETRKWSIEDGRYYVLVGKSSKEIVLSEEIKIKSNDKNINKEYPKAYRFGDVQNVTDEDFEFLLGHKIPKDYLNIEDATEENTIEQLKDTKVGSVIFKHETKRMDKLLEEQKINEAMEVMVIMQRALKKIYQAHNNTITKEMVDEFLNLARTDSDFEECKFIEEYFKNFAGE